MKTIEQLLALADNPYYTFRPEERELLDNFLSKKQEKDSKPTRTKSSKRLEKSTDVRVRNIVDKTIDDVPEVNN